MEIKNIINLKIMKCYQLLLTKQGLIYNIGSYILIIIIFIYSINSNIFFIVEYDKLFKKIDLIFKFIKKENSYESMTNLNNNAPVKKGIINNNKKNKINKQQGIEQVFKKIKNKKSSKLNPKKMNDIYESKKENNKIIINKNKNDIKKRLSKKYKTNLSKKITLKNTDAQSASKTKLINKNSDELFIRKNKNLKIFENADKNNITIFRKNSRKENKEKKNNYINFNDYELNTMTYDKALKYDKRTYIQYYISLLRTNHILIFAFVCSNDYNSTALKISLFFFSFALYYTVNALFFTDSKIHDIYTEKGSYNFIYQIPLILYSTIISIVVNSIISFFSLSQKDVLKVKNGNLKNNLNKEKEKLVKFLRLKFIYFFKLSIIFLIFFWYYLSCFCAVYTNTQIHLLKDTLVSFGLSLLYPIPIYLIPGILRIYSLKNKNKKCIYSISKLMQFI